MVDQSILYLTIYKLAVVQQRGDVTEIIKVFEVEALEDLSRKLAVNEDIKAQVKKLCTMLKKTSLEDFKHFYIYLRGQSDPVSDSGIFEIIKWG